MYEYKVIKIKSIYDGDTMKVVLDLGFNITSLETLRLYGINAPELKGSERDKGLISRDYLRNRIYTAIDNNIPIIVRTHKDKTGKYGRLLAEVFIDNVNINEELIKKDLAVEYML